jgi:DNA-binding GntR family transcriptional regulator
MCAHGEVLSLQDHGSTFAAGVTIFCFVFLPQPRYGLDISICNLTVAEPPSRSLITWWMSRQFHSRRLARNSTMQETVVPVARKATFASAHEKERLQLSGCRRVLRLSHVALEAGRAHSYHRIVLPLHRLPGLNRQFASTATLPSIASRHGLTLGSATERIKLLDAPSDAVVHLGICADEKVLELDRITATADGLPIEWRVILMRADKPYSD